jgi:hypothetical protein
LASTIEGFDKIFMPEPVAEIVEENAVEEPAEATAE